MWFLPSYNRPEQCQAVIDQINKVGCTGTGLLWVNGRDRMDEYAKIKLPNNWHGVSSRENIGVCGAMNECFKRFPDEPFYGLICDDEYTYSTNWEKRLSEAAGGWKISHGNEGWQSQKRIHSYVTVGGDLIRECGWWALPGLWHWYHDDVQELLARECGLRVFCDDVMTEHKHYLAGKAPKDITYSAGESKRIQDQQVFEKWKAEEAAALIERIKHKSIFPSNIYNWATKTS
jgi:hypothetical protein